MASLDELKELVQGTLEAKGVLGRLKVCTARHSPTPAWPTFMCR